jgi:D-alanyl-D-alanine carboxypeptidase (penicillin-binding protein 5/6)
MDADTGKVLSSQNPHMFLPPASTLKVFTALVALNNLKLDDKVPVSAYAASAPASKLNIKPGETYSVQDMLYAILLASSNDASRAMGERISGSEERFAKFMTQKAREWGAYRSRFENANGLPADDQYSCAYDLALVFRKAMENPTFAKIVNTKTYELQDGKEVRNHNRFLFTTPLAVGGKTGYTKAARHTYVGMFQNGDKRIIVSLLGSDGKWADLRTLIEKGFGEIGAPIAKLPPAEEKLARARVSYAGASSGGRSRKRYANRSYQKGKSVMTASMVSYEGNKKLRSQSNRSKGTNACKRKKTSQIIRSAPDQASGD